MSTDITISEVTRLQHFLLDVWDWDQLHAIGHDLLIAHIVREPGDADLLDHSREADARLTEHLSTRYARATAEIDSTIAALPASELLEALLEQLHGQLLRLSDIEVSYREWYNRHSHPETHSFERTVNGVELTEQQVLEAERRHHARQREAWRCVADDLAFYLNKLANKVDRIRPTTSHVATDNHRQPQHRIRWKASTATYVHLAKELLLKGYLDMPALNGKEGDGNVTELFRRFGQCFIVKGRSGEELMPDELQRRFNGRPLAAAKAARLNLPEAEEM